MIGSRINKVQKLTIQKRKTDTSMSVESIDPLKVNPRVLRDRCSMPNISISETGPALSISAALAMEVNGIFRQTLEVVNGWDDLECRTVRRTNDEIQQGELSTNQHSGTQAIAKSSTSVRS